MNEEKKILTQTAKRTFEVAHLNDEAACYFTVEDMTENHCNCFKNFRGCRFFFRLCWWTTRGQTYDRKSTRSLQENFGCPQNLLPIATGKNDYFYIPDQDKKLYDLSQKCIFYGHLRFTPILQY